MNTSSRLEDFRSATFGLRTTDEFDAAQRLFDQIRRTVEETQEIIDLAGLPENGSFPTDLGLLIRRLLQDLERVHLSGPDAALLAAFDLHSRNAQQITPNSIKDYLRSCDRLKSNNANTLLDRLEGRKLVEKSGKLFSLTDLGKSAAETLARDLAARAF